MSQQSHIPQDRIKVVDMQKQMMMEAIRVAEQALQRHQIQRQVAKHIKIHFDNHYYPNWHCLVGKHFTSVVTYQSRHYIHFQIADKNIILFKFG